MRPKSIEHFALVYAAIIIVGLASTALSWNAMLAQVSVQQMMAQIGAASVYIVAGVGLAIQLLLWFFISRRGSAIAKWIFVLLTAFAIISGVWSLAMSGAPSWLNGILNVTMLVLQVIGIWLVFRPDTAEWFGEVPVE